MPAPILNQTGVPLGGSGTLPVELRQQHRSKFLTYRRGVKCVKVDQPELNIWPSMETPRCLSWTQGDGTLVDVKVAVDVAVHGEMLAGHGAAAAAREAASSGSARTLRIPPASGPAATGVKQAAPAAQKRVDNRRSRSPRSGGRRRDRRQSCSGPSSSHGRRAGDGPEHRHGASARRPDRGSGRSGRSSFSPCGPSWAR